MAFHLEGPWLTTTGRKRGPRKWATAQAKQQAQQRQAEWDRRLVQFEQMSPKFSTGAANAPQKTISDYMPRTPPGRETTRIPSQDTGWVTCVKSADKENTGNAVVGIAQMAKSNAVPVFDSDHIVEIARMRR